MTLDALQDQHPTEGLLRDEETGHYRILPGYGHQAHRYAMHETWLDEDDGMWIDGKAVDRESQKAEQNGVSNGKR
ncbi:MAG TPA: hypothetical protein VGE04_19725 [Chloroflexia bacterium]